VIMLCRAASHLALRSLHLLRKVRSVLTKIDGCGCLGMGKRGEGEGAQTKGSFATRGGGELATQRERGGRAAG
jgi:hypothetical protein